MQQARPLLFALIANGAGHAYFAISLPSLARSMAMPDTHVGLILSLSALLLIITGPFWGSVCDKFGRKIVLTTGLLATAITTFMLAMVIDNAALLSAQFAHLLFIIRVLQAALSAGLKPATQATVSDITQSDQRMQAMGMMGATFGAGTMIGGVLAMLSGQSWLVEGFILLSLLMTVSSLWVVFKLPDTRRQSHETKSRLYVSSVLVYLLSTVLCLTIYSGLQPITSWLLQDQFSLNGDQTIKYTGGIMMSSMLTMTVTQVSLIRFKSSRSEVQSVVRSIGSLLSAVALITCALSATPQTLAFSMGLLGIGFGLFLPSNLALMTTKVLDRQQGKLGGVNGLCQGIGLTLGPVLGSWVYQVHPQLFYYLASTAMLLIVLMVMFQNKASQHLSH